MVREVELRFTIVGGDDGKVPNVPIPTLSSVSLKVMKMVSETKTAKKPIAVRSCLGVIDYSLLAVSVLLQEQG